MNEENEEIIGVASLFNDSIRKTVVGNKEVVKELKTEQERLDALEEIFDIHPTLEQKLGISPEMSLG